MPCLSWHAMLEHFGRERRANSREHCAPIDGRHGMRMKEEAAGMEHEQNRAFNTAHYLASEGDGRSIVRLRAKQVFFSQGADADSIFYLQTGRAKLTVVSKRGKEATVTMLAAGDFMGEESLTAVDAKRSATACAMVACVALKIAREQMLRVLHEEHAFSKFFLNFMLLRGIRTQADLVDQLFNSSERRLARALLLMADFSKPGQTETEIPSVTQEMLAEMIGTTRSRVSFFMNRFRKLGYIDYNGKIHVKRALLNVVLHDQLPEQNASRPPLLDPPPSKARAQKRAQLL